MVNAFATGSSVPLRTLVVVGRDRPPVLPDGAEWYEGGHPLPNAASVAAAQRVHGVASASRPGDLVVLLLSGGGSALMASPSPGISLEDKQRTIRTLLEGGADIQELNTVRKHVSAIKGGQLAAAAPGSILTLAISDVVGDDPSAIASGPTVADDTTFADALDVLKRRGGYGRYPEAVLRRLTDGAADGVGETPKPGDPRLARAVTRVIGTQHGAVEGARVAAEALGYHVHVVSTPVTGEARTAAVTHVESLTAVLARLPRPACVISAGETTVTVVGRGRGGRNQEFALAMAPLLSRLGDEVVAASLGTDGIDGPTTAAGAIVDTTTAERAAAAGLEEARAYLDDNNTYPFFERLGDLITTGPTGTNVGDLQVILVR